LQQPLIICLAWVILPVINIISHLLPLLVDNVLGPAAGITNPDYRDLAVATVQLDPRTHSTITATPQTTGPIMIWISTWHAIQPQEEGLCHCKTCHAKCHCRLAWHIKCMKSYIFLMISEVMTHWDVYMNEMTRMGVTLWQDRGWEKKTHRYKLKMYRWNCGQIKHFITSDQSQQSKVEAQSGLQIKRLMWTGPLYPHKTLHILQKISRFHSNWTQ
jgi:hypothetical protein